MFRSGQLHVTSTVPPEKVESYQEKYPNNIQVDPFYGTYYYRFNTKKTPFDSKLVRQALSLALDRTLIVERVTKGGQKRHFLLPRLILILIFHPLPLSIILKKLKTY